MRIAQLISGRTINGAVRHALMLSALLARRGHEVLLLHRPELDLGGLSHPRIETLQTRFRRTRSALSETAAALRAFGAEVVHSHMSSASAYGAILRTFWGFPSVATAHKRLLQLHWAFNDYVITPSAVTAAYHHRVNLVPRRKLKVIPNFIDAAERAAITPEARLEARARLGLAPDALVIGSVGDIVAYKRPSQLILAARPLLQGPAPAVLVLVGGTGDAGELRRAQAAAQGLGDRVRFLGRRLDVDRILPAFDLYAMASRTEEMPIAVLEAMAVGLPVVGTTVGGMPELVAEGETGRLVPPGDVGGLALQLATLAAEQALRNRMGAAARARALAAFAPGPIVDRIEAVLARAAG